MKERESWQVVGNAATIYEEFFVPAIFQEWAPRMIEATRIKPGDKVLDVACGTGVVARAAAARVGPAGSVVGLDLNEGMLAVARQKAPTITWRRGEAEALPFDDASFDAVVSQFALMFFGRRQKALKEMGRVLRPGGRLAVAVWDALETSPGYAALTGLLQRLFGDQVADILRAPFVLGDVREVSALFAEAGFSGVTVKTYVGAARFPSLQAWVYTDIKGSPIDQLIDEEQFEMMMEQAEEVLHPYVTPEGKVEFVAPAHIVSVTV